MFDNNFSLILQNVGKNIDAILHSIHDNIRTRNAL